MGCSASRPNTYAYTNSNTILTKSHHHHHHCSQDQDNPFSSSVSAFASTSTSSSSSSRFSSPQPVTRALSLPNPLVHHPPSRKGDTHHLVSLTSTTYGSLLLIEPKVPTVNGQDCPDNHQPTITTLKTQISTNPVETLSPDSVINTWELMDGLDDDDDDGFDSHLVKPISSDFDHPTVQVSVSPSSKKPLWKHLSEESLLSNMDPNVGSSYRRALSSRQLGYNHQPKGTRNQIVIYFTSLRGIRKTYEDCCSVRMIFKGMRVAVDERDISMDSTYRKELQSLVGGKAISLPQVFIKGKLMGGVEEIKQLNENGELGKLLEGFPVRDPGLVCKSCGDARFVPCPNCCGSRKVFDEDEDQLRRCLDCNENGLIRCPDCGCF